MSKDFIEKKLMELSVITGTEIKFSEDAANENKIVPAYNINEIISKILGLFVYQGINVPHSFAPSYNNVHACIEFWKRKIAEDEQLISNPTILVSPIREIHIEKESAENGSNKSE